MDAKSKGLSRVSERLRASDGFTLLESLIGAIILAVGLLGTFLTLDATVQVDYRTIGREGAVTLARQITEDARAIPFSQISNSTITDTLQQLPGLANQSSGSSWQIDRRGVTFTISVSESTQNDSKDHTGLIAVKEVTANVSWTIAGVTRSFQEVTTISSAGQAVGLATSALEMTSPFTSTQPTITSSSQNPLQFQVTAPTATTAIIWTVDGVGQSWTATSSGTTWTSSTWSVLGLSDGTYQIGAAAENAQGVVGPAVTIPLVLLRNVPSAPDVTGYGFNTNLLSSGSAKTVVELQWQRNPERNVTGYRVYNPSGTLICTTTNTTSNASCGTNAWCTTPTECIDLSPPSPTASNLTYQVAATYLDTNGITQQGQLTSVTVTGTPSYTFTLAPSTLDTGTNCSGTPAHDMLTSYTAGSDTTVAGGAPVFCSNAFDSGDAAESGGTATAYITNPSGTACHVTATLNVDGSSTGALTATDTLPASQTGVTKYTFSFTGGSLLTMATGDRFNLSYNLAGSGCGTGSSAPLLHYGGATYPGTYQTPPTPVDVPNTPASLTVTTQSDGTALLSWPEPSSGAPISAFRIYRDGDNYTNRYGVVDTAGSCINGTCTFTDTNRTGSHSYYVTSVGDDTPGSNMAESTAVGPVSG